MTIQYKPQLIFFVILIFCQGQMFSQKEEFKENKGGIHFSTSLILNEAIPFKIGSGSEFGLWYQHFLDKRRSLMLSLDYRKQIGYDIKASEFKRYNYPTIQIQLFKDTRLTALKYLDIAIGIKQKSRKKNFSWAAGFLFGSLVGVEGGVVEKSRYQSIEVTLGNSQFSRPGDIHITTLDKNDFNRLDIGVQALLYYQIKPKLALRVKGHHGFRQVFKASFLGIPTRLYNKSIALGCLIQIY